MGHPATVLLFLTLPFTVFCYSGFKPIGYYVKIDVSNMTTSQTFNGTVTINLELQSTKIELDAVDLNVTSVNMTQLDPIKERPCTYNATGTKLLIYCPENTLLKTLYNLNITFNGTYRNNMTGFAKVGYKDNSTLRYIGVTSFEPDYTRYAFPCADEIDLNVNITLDVITTNQTVLSNVQHASTETTGTKTTYRFTSYPKMPVYQLGWIVMEENTFEVISDYKADGIGTVPTRALYQHKNYISWATNLTVVFLEAVSHYTQLNHLTKLEQIVVPEFSESAVQTRGLISYSEEAFLVEDTPTTSSMRVKHDVALRVAQNVLKQWFGDYLTMNTWNNSWLMDGFVEHLKFSICDSIMPGWEFTKHEAVDLIQPALSMDSPLREITPLSTLDKYRGGALIRMLQGILGEDLFKKAIVEYLKSKKDGGGITPEDLWNGFFRYVEDDANLNKRDLNVVMKTWTDTPGYPVLNVSSKGTYFCISQIPPSRYVNVTYLLQGKSSVNSVWLNNTYNATINASGSKWILLNLNQTGYYRVNYDEKVLSGLITDFAKLPNISRSQLVDDMFSLALSGDTKMDQLFQFLLVLKDEADYYTWNSALRNFQNLIDKFYGQTSYDQLKPFILNLMQTVINNVGWYRGNQDSHTDILKRVMILEKACAFGHKMCIEKAVEIFKSSETDKKYDADLNMGLMCSAVANSSDNTRQVLLMQKKVTPVPRVRSAVLKALTCTKNVELLNDYLTNITLTTPSTLNPKDKDVFLQALASTPFGANVLLNWLLEELKTTINIGTTTLGPAYTSTERSANLSSKTDVSGSTVQRLSEEDIERILFLIQPKLTSSEQYNKLNDFVTANSNSGLSNFILDLLKKTKVEVNKQYKWALERNEGIVKWLQTASTTPGVIPNIPTSTITPSGPTGKPSSASSIFSSLALTFLVVASHYFMPHSQIFS